MGQYLKVNKAKESWLSGLRARARLQFLISIASFSSKFPASIDFLRFVYHIYITLLYSTSLHPSDSKQKNIATIFLFIKAKSMFFDHIPCIKTTYLCG